MEIEYCAAKALEMNFEDRPTGFRRLTPGLLRADRAAAAFAGLPAGVSLPGQLLAAFKAAAPRLGLSVRLVHAIDWLFRFSMPQDWEEGGRPIVWPSAETQREALGLSLTQVKAINRMLIEAGLLTMRDSPNGKRYGRRDRQQRIVEAYGFDLSPLAARHTEFLHLAMEGQAERQLLGRLRRRVTIARKGIAQLLETAREYGFHGEEWPQLASETRHLMRILKSVVCPEDMKAGVVSLERRQAAAREHLETLLGVVDSAPKEPENQPHTIATNNLINLPDTVNIPQKSGQALERPPLPLPTLKVAPTSIVVAKFNLAPAELAYLAPRLRYYLRRPDPTWSDIITAADYLRDELTISQLLWGKACLLLGREAAAVAVAIVSTKEPGSIRSPGGYFYGMMAKARAHELNLDRDDLEAANRQP